MLTYTTSDGNRDKRALALSVDRSGPWIVATVRYSDRRGHDPFRELVFRERSARRLRIVLLDLDVGAWVMGPRKCKPSARALVDRARERIVERWRLLVERACAQIDAPAHVFPALVFPGPGRKGPAPTFRRPPESEDDSPGPCFPGPGFSGSGAQGPGPDFSGADEDGMDRKGRGGTPRNPDDPS